ncbi:MAG: DUF6291 domain-containing protein [Christensenellales bacterium]
MGKYERRTRPGWMLYHENLPMLEVLSPEDAKALIVALTRYSIALANDEPPPNFSSVASPMAQAICLLIAPKIERDDSLYKTKCERSALNRSKQKATVVDRGQPELTKADSGRATITGTPTVTETGTETGDEAGAESTASSETPAAADRNPSGDCGGLLQEAERRAHSKHDNASELDIQRELRDLQRAGELARTYGLPQTLAVYDSILEDVKRCDWEQVESAIKEASASNSRGCVSVNFYRTILKNRRIPRSHLKDL